MVFTGRKMAEGENIVKEMDTGMSLRNWYIERLTSEGKASDGD